MSSTPRTFKPFINLTVNYKMILKPITIRLNISFCRLDQCEKKLFEPDNSKEFNKIIIIYFSKAMAEFNAKTVKLCEPCDYFVQQHKKQEHSNLHLPPSKLLPITEPNAIPQLSFKDIMSKDYLGQDDNMDVRSILPDFQPEHGRKNANVGGGYSDDDEKSNVSRKTGLFSNVSVSNDNLDLDSNLYLDGVGVQPEDPLLIEREVVLKIEPVRVERKILPTYTNSNSLARSKIDGGGCDKKVGNTMAQSRRLGGENEPVYEIKFGKAEEPKNIDKISVNIGRKTVPGNFEPVRTNAGSKDEKLTSKVYKTYPKENNGGSSIYEDEQGQHDGKIDHRKYPVHPFQCVDCHGFYCQTCKSTIPPNLRPFWDESEDPERIEYYKSLQRDAMKRHERCVKHDKQQPKK